MATKTKIKAGDFFATWLGEGVAVPSSRDAANVKAKAKTKATEKRVSKKEMIDHMTPGICRFCADRSPLDESCAAKHCRCYEIRSAILALIKSGRKG